jgi:hypothetical protein
MLRRSRRARCGIRGATLIHKFLHDVAWSFHEGKLHDLFLHDGITFATWGLVLVTVLLVLDGWRRGKEQQDRWKREDQQHKQDREEERARWSRDDEIRLDQQKPKLTFGVEPRSTAENDRSPVTLWCANLGSVPFHIETAYIRRLTDFGDDQHDAHFEPLQLVSVGEMSRMTVPSEIFRGLLLSVDMQFWLSVTTASTRIETDPKVYSLFCVEKGRVAKIERGFHEVRKVSCAVCESVGFYQPSGIESQNELLRVMNLAEQELAGSCPHHFSTVLYSVLNTEGRRTWYREQREGD